MAGAEAPPLQLLVEKWYWLLLLQLCLMPLWQPPLLGTRLLCCSFS